MIKRIAKFALISLTIISSHAFAEICSDTTGQVAGINFDCTCTGAANNVQQCKTQKLTTCRDEGAGRVHISGDIGLNCTCSGSSLDQPGQICYVTPT